MENLEIEPLAQASDNLEVEPLEEASLQEVEMETPPEPPKSDDIEIWCLIVGMVGTAFPVLVKRTARVWELQKTIKNEAVEIFGDFNAAQLRLFLAKRVDGQWLSEVEVKGIENGDTEPARSLMERGHLASMSPLAAIFEDYKTNTVHILVPAPVKTSEIELTADILGKRKRSEQSNDAETVEVPKEELVTLFGSLKDNKQTENNLVTTTGLSEFWKGHGGFPTSYFVRREEKVLWGLVLRLVSKREKRIVLAGSPGVGKSCFLTLVSFYLAFVEKRKVLVVRRLKGFSESSSVVFLDGEHDICIRKTNLSAAQMKALPERKEFEGSIVLIDGYSEDEVKSQFGLFPFQLLATSRDYEDNDSLYLVALPAWRYSNLLQYAESTIDDWKRSTGSGQEAITNLVDQQYFYSGGNLRDFCRKRSDVKNGIDGLCGVVTKAETVDLELEPELLDRIRGLYVLDPSNEEHYLWFHNWVYPMDSGYAYRCIGRYMDLKTCLHHYKLSQTLNTGFGSAAYEQCFHSAVGQSEKISVLMVNVVVNFDPSSSNQKYDQIEIRNQTVACGGRTIDECLMYVSTLVPGTYWHPECPTFPMVSAVVVCEATLRGSNAKETIVAIISTSVTDNKSFDSEVWRKLNKALDDNEDIAVNTPRVLVVVGPDPKTCKQFSLKNAPSSDKFMVCCYDPLKFLRRPSHARIA